MQERNYIVLRFFPLGGYSVLAQFADIMDALTFLNAVMLENDSDAEIYGIKQVYVNGSESVHRYEKEEKENESC